MKKCRMCEQYIYLHEETWLHAKGKTIWCWDRPASVATPPVEE